MMLRELTSGPHENPWLEVLVIASLFRDSIPWIHELGMEAYRGLREGRPGGQEQLEEFTQMVEFTIHGPIAHELFGRSKYMYMLMESVEPMLIELKEHRVRPVRQRGDI